jgi:hypothetical protein
MLAATAAKKAVASRSQMLAVTPPVSSTSVSYTLPSSDDTMQHAWSSTQAAKASIGAIRAWKMNWS